MRVTAFVNAPSCGHTYLKHRVGVPFLVVEEGRPNGHTVEHGGLEEA